MAVKWNDKILLSPKEKGHKYANELKYNVHLTNDNQVKLKANGKERTLSDTQKAYRSGYLSARKDIGRAYASKQKKSVVIYKG